MNCEQIRQYYLLPGIKMSDINNHADLREHMDTCAFCQVFLSSIVLQDTRGCTFDEITNSLDRTKAMYRFRLNLFTKYLDQHFNENITPYIAFHNIGSTE